MHPAEKLHGVAGDTLDGVNVVLGVTGSIAAVKCVELARELIRRGASVRAVMTDAAQGIVTADALEFATGRDVVTGLTGDVEHVTLCGEDSWGDVLLIAPATANTIGKAARGIDDTPVTSCFSVAAAHMPVVVCPAMHGTMEDNPAVQANLRTLEDWDVTVVASTRAEGKAKLAEIATIVAHVERAVAPQDLTGQRVLVVTGSTAEPLDDVRILTNVSTGRTGMVLAEAAFARGADVTLWMGRRHVEPPHHLEAERFDTVDDLVDRAADVAGFDVVICPAAISDYKPVRETGKISSGRDDLSLNLEATPKLLPLFEDHADGRVVGFKLETDVTVPELIERAESRMKTYGIDMIVANRLEDIDPDARTVHVLAAEDRTEASGTTREVADAVLDRVVALG